MESVPQRRQIIVQKYIKNPLLINGLKWDLRIYVFVSSFCPLIAYISDDGLVRFATDQYTMNSKVRHRSYEQMNIIPLILLIIRYYFLETLRSSYELLRE